MLSSPGIPGTQRSRRPHVGRASRPKGNQKHSLKKKINRFYDFLLFPSIAAFLKNKLAGIKSCLIQWSPQGRPGRKTRLANGPRPGRPSPPDLSPCSFVTVCHSFLFNFSGSFSTPNYGHQEKGTKKCEKKQPHFLRSALAWANARSDSISCLLWITGESHK